MPDMSDLRLIRIPKRNGEFRTVAVCGKGLRRYLRGFLPGLEAMAMLLDAHGVQHGFVPGRSPVTNALRHVGYRRTLSLDLSNCFDRLTYDDTRRLLHGNVSSSVLRSLFDADGIARQGLPTSPAICNIVLSVMDSEIMVAMREEGIVAEYTRYADDLTFSTDDDAAIPKLARIAVVRAGLVGQEVNPRKTKVQSAAAGRRIVTGVAVDDTGIHPTREAKRRHRSALHRARLGTTAGAAVPAKSVAEYRKYYKRFRGESADFCKWAARKAAGHAAWLELRRPNTAAKALKFAEDANICTRNLAIMLADRAAEELAGRQA